MCYGVKVLVEGLESPDFSWLSEQTGYFPCTLLEGDVARGRFRFEGGPSYYTMYQDGYVTVESQSLPVLAEIVKWRLAETVARVSPQFVFLYGEAVRAADGGGVVVIGPRLSGKARLAEAFVEAGAEPWSRGVVVVGPDGVYPYPRESLPGEGLGVDLVGSVVFDPRADFEVEPLSVGMTALQMMPSMLIPGEEMPTALSLLGQIAASAKVRVKGVRGEASLAAEALGRGLSER